MSQSPFRPGAACRALVLALVTCAVAVVPAAASGASKQHHRYSAAGWIRVDQHHHALRAPAKQIHARPRVRTQTAVRPQSVGVSRYGIAAGGNLQNLATDELARELDV